MARGYNAREVSVNGKWPAVVKEVNLVKWRFKDENKPETGGLEAYKESSKIVFLDRSNASSERILELNSLRRKSAVKEILYRGQEEANETLDVKGKTGIIKDGFFHATPSLEYASAYGTGTDISREVVKSKASGEKIDTKGVVMQIMIYSDKCLDLSKLGGDTRSARSRVYDYKDDGPGSKTKMSRMEVADKILNWYESEYKRLNNSEPPIGSGLSKDEMFSSRDDYLGRLKMSIYDGLGSKGGLMKQYELIGKPWFKRLMNSTGFDTVKYVDAGTTFPSYATKDGWRIKAYYGDKPVNLKSKNMFDQ